MRHLRRLEGDGLAVVHRRGDVQLRVGEAIQKLFPLPPQVLALLAHLVLLGGCRVVGRRSVLAVGWRRAHRPLGSRSPSIIVEIVEELLSLRTQLLRVTLNLVQSPLARVLLSILSSYFLFGLQILIISLLRALVVTLIGNL